MAEEGHRFPFYLRDRPIEILEVALFVEVRVEELAIAQLPDPLKMTVDVDGATHYRLNPEAIGDLGFLCQYTF